MMLDVKNERFMDALRASLENRQVDWEMEMSSQEWLVLLQMADAHHVLPMIYDAVYACPAAKTADPQMMSAYKRRAMHLVMTQTMKTEESLAMLRHLLQAGVKPIVVKGIVCRDLYPNPDHRMSGDEDVLVPENQYAMCHEAMTAFGMQMVDPQQDFQSAYEVPYGKPMSPIYIELHKHLFPPESEAYGDLNRFFDGLHERSIQVTIRGTQVPTMCETDHLFYLICHAFKHFLHSGFGIRQVCDIVLFANRYGERIDWYHVLENCRAISADCFTAALFEIGRKNFGFNAAKACYPEEWQAIEVDETEMLEELLRSGVYGDASMSRKHSSRMTLHAVKESKQGKAVTGSVLGALFPSAGSLKGRYPYLVKHPYLLPAAWVSRLMKYAFEPKERQYHDISESIRIGQERIELMRKYRIIK